MSLRSTVSLCLFLASAQHVRTPVGFHHPSCIHGVPSGTFVHVLPPGSPLGAAGSARVRYSNGSSEIVAPCAHPRGAAPRRVPPPASAPPAPPLWKHWPQHWWLGLSWAHFTQPPLPLNASIFSINATWRVPPLPLIRTGNASDPWFQAPPTESWWVGLQGGAVLQPVLELNGLMPGAYDGVSWACCAAGMAWYSFPLVALPGEEIVGDIVRVSGAEVGAEGEPYVYVTLTGVRSAARGYEETRLYSAMDAAGPGWEPTWAEVVQESYFVTDCRNLPCGGAGAFADVRVATAPAGRPFNETRPTIVDAVPWSATYEIEGAAAPRHPVCNGSAAFDDTMETAAVSFDCRAPAA